MSLTAPAVTEAVPRSSRQRALESMRSRHREWMQGLLERESDLQDPRDRLLAVFEHLEAGLVRGGSHVGAVVAHGEPDTADLAREHLREVEAHVAERCVAAALPEHVGHALTLLVQGARVEAAVHRSVQPARTARTAAAMLLAVYEGEALF